MTPSRLGRALCVFGRHEWERHPDFTSIYVRRCRRCPRVESRWPWMSGWTRRKHLEKAGTS